MKVHYVPEDEYNLPWIAYIIAAFAFGACIGYGAGLGNGAERERKHVLSQLVEQYSIHKTQEMGEMAYEFPLPDNFAPTEADLQALLLHISTSTSFADKQEIIEGDQLEMPPARVTEPPILDSSPELETSASPFWIFKNFFGSL